MLKSNVAARHRPERKIIQKPFPEGWFHVGYSDELKPGDVQPLHYFADELVLFRTESGKAQLVNAYCPHLGAHIGIGGTVVGERIRCPFHNWEYGTDGKCKKIPYNDKIPGRGAEIRSWTTEESSGLIFVWHSPWDREPQWPVPKLAEYGLPDWTEYFLRDGYTIHSTPQEILENVPDYAHAMYIHGSPEIPHATESFEDHMMYVTFHTDLPDIGGKAINTVEAHGLGVVVAHADGHGSKAFFVTYIPIDYENVFVRFTMMAAKSTPEDPTGEISIGSAKGTVREFLKDLPIWENKTYRTVPLLVKNDGPIGRFRVWAKQFYNPADFDELLVV